MFRVGKIVAVFAFIAAGWAYTLTAQEPKPTDAKAKAVDLTALREAVATASKRGENVDEIRTALDAFEKALPNAKAGTVPTELQALRDAVDAANRKGENVDSIIKELTAVEMAVAGRSLAKPKVEPPRPNPLPNPPPIQFPNVPFPPLPNPGGIEGGIDVAAFNKAMELRKKALEIMLKNPRDPDAQKLLQEANDMMMKAARGGGAGGIGGIAPIMPAFPDVGRMPDRARFGIRMERVPAVAAEQLGLDPNVGIVVSMVMAGSAAEKAGVKVHDIVLEFAGKPVIDNFDDFTRRVNDVKKGEKVDLVVMRKGKKVEMKGVELPDVQPFRVPPQLDRPALPLPAPILPLLPVMPGDAPVLPGDPPLPVPINRVPAGVDRPAAIPAGFNSVNYTSDNTSYTLKASKDETRYVITGSFDAAGRATFGNANIEKDGRTHVANALDKLPTEFQADVEKLLKTVQPRK